MEQLFITNLEIKNVRHLNEIFIPLSENQIKHLILTGKNGSGKTSVVEALAGYLNNTFTDVNMQINEAMLNTDRKLRDKAVQNGEDEEEILKLYCNICKSEEVLKKKRNGMDIQFCIKADSIIAFMESNYFILAYYRADRIF